MGGEAHAGGVDGPPIEAASDSRYVASGELVRVPVAGGELACHIDGAGPALVLMHTSGLDSRMWTEQQLAFREHYTVIAVDQRGHGDSPDPDKPYEPADDVATALSEFGIGEAAVVGIESGADFALRLAVSGRLSVRALVLANPVIAWLMVEIASADPEVDAIMGERLEEFFTDPSAEPLRDAALSRDAETLIDVLASDPDMLSEGHPARPLLRTMFAANIGEVFRGELMMLPAPGTDKRLADLDIPTLVLSNQGREPQLSVAALAELLPDVTVVEIATSATLINMERPDLFNAAVLEFLVSRGGRKALT